MASSSTCIESCLASLDWNIRATCTLQPKSARLLFGHHVHISPEHSQHDAMFTSFPRLPTEIQLLIISFCDPATLFRLMGVSRWMRDEAQNLFWGDPSTRYIISGEWLLGGGHSRHTDDDFSSLANMQYIEVTFADFGSTFSYEWEESSRIPADKAKRITFWETLRRRFPRVTDVVLTEGRGLPVGAPVPRAVNEFGPGQEAFSAQWAELYGTVTELATVSPGDMVVSLSQEKWLTRNLSGRTTRYLWQQRSGNDDPEDWQLINASWEPQRVTPPPKKYAGIVGAYQRYKRNKSDLIDLAAARQRHAMRAIEAYYHSQQAPCVCTAPRCSRQFGPQDDVELHHCLEGERRTPLPPCDMLRAAFERHDALLDLKKQQLTDEMARMRAEWGKKDSVERQATSQSFLEQLQNDPLYASDKEPETSWIWGSFKHDMRIFQNDEYAEEDGDGEDYEYFRCGPCQVCERRERGVM